MAAPAVIDAIEFARSEQTLSGSLPVANLKRLDDVLFDGAGTVAYSVEGVRDEKNRPHLGVAVTGRLHLQCQRCLGLLDYPLELSNTVRVVPQGMPLEDDDVQDPDSPDVIETTGELDLAALIEDEILLALPLAPRHAEGECESRIGTEHPATSAQSAFAKLAALKRPHKQ
jgi:uncharacterized protein